jgi:hypothetical protein
MRVLVYVFFEFINCLIDLCSRIELASYTVVEPPELMARVEISSGNDGGGGGGPLSTFGATSRRSPLKRLEAAVSPDGLAAKMARPSRT